MPATKFDKPIFPGAKLVSATVTVTNTSGSYSNTFLDERIATSMKPYQIEVGDPSIFNDKISITTGDGSFTIACNSVAGSTSVTVGFLKIADDPTEVTSAEFDILNNRIGDLDSLSTTAKTNTVAAINENTQAITSNTQAIANKLQSFGYVQSPDMTRQQVMALNPTDMGNIYGYICNYGYASIIGFVHKTQEYGGQLRLTYTDRIQYRKYYGGTWSAWQELAGFQAVTNPTADQLKQAKLLFVRCYNADGTGLQQTVTVDPNSTKNQVSIEVWNGSTVQRTIGKIEWNKTNGTLTISTDHSDRGTTLTMSNAIYMVF